MARRKSITDVRNQYLRMYRNAVVGGNSERAERVRQTAMRYMDNMRGTRSYQRDLAVFNRADAAASRALNERNTNAFERNADVAEAANRRMQNRRYSRSTYMGLNQG